MPSKIARCGDAIRVGVWKGEDREDATQSKRPVRGRRCGGYLKAFRLAIDNESLRTNIGMDRAPRWGFCSCRNLILQHYMT